MDASTLDACDANYLDANRVFMAVSRRGEYVERRDVAITCCGLPAETLNWGFLKPPYADVATTAEAVRTYFAPRRLPFRLCYRDAAERPDLAELQALGWRLHDEPVPGMARAIPEAVPPPPAGLHIERVDGETLAAYRETAFLGFGYPVAVAPVFLTERLLALPQVRLYAGRLGDQVVATSMLVVTGRVAGIYWVATRESHRGRGYGEALTWAAVAGGGALGCELASLQASKLGRPVYARMGFAHVLDYVHVLSPPVPA